jgi:hypothetical protein
MRKPVRSAGEAAPPETEDQAIRQRVKELTSQALKQGRIDPETVRDVVRAVIGRPAAGAAATGAEAREHFADVVKALDEALVKSASAAHSALEQIAARGKDFTDNDLKEALVSLRKLEEDYIAAANCLVAAISGDLRREMSALVAHAQNVGVEASARLATSIGNITGGVATAPGLAAMRGATVRMALLASGMLAGVADALHDQTEKKDK